MITKKKESNFHKARMISGLTQAQIAKMLGVNQSTIHSLEKKGCFCTKTARRYAEVMNLPTIFLLDGLD